MQNTVSLSFSEDFVDLFYDSQVLFAELYIRLNIIYWTFYIHGVCLVING